MAESKRQSMSGRVAVATPRVASTNSPSTVSLDTAMARCIGAKIRLTLTTPARTIDGHLLALSTIYNQLVLGPTPNGPYTLVSLPQISAFQLLALPSASSTPPVPVSVPDIRARVSRALAAALDKESHRGKGVSKEAQDIFDMLRKTMPVKWEGKEIVVSESVVVPPPYRGSDARVVAGASAQGLAHVRKAVDSVRQRLEAKGGVQSSAPAVPAQRKGG